MRKGLSHNKRGTGSKPAFIDNFMPIDEAIKETVIYLQKLYDFLPYDPTAPYDDKRIEQICSYKINPSFLAKQKYIAAIGLNFKTIHKRKKDYCRKQTKINKNIFIYQETAKAIREDIQADNTLLSLFIILCFYCHTENKPLPTKITEQDETILTETIKTINKKTEIFYYGQNKTSENDIITQYPVIIWKENLKEKEHQKQIILKQKEINGFITKQKNKNSSLTPMPKLKPWKPNQHNNWTNKLNSWTNKTKWF